MASDLPDRAREFGRVARRRLARIEDRVRRRGADELTAGERRAVGRIRATAAHLSDQLAARLDEQRRRGRAITVGPLTSTTTTPTDG